MNKRQFFSKKLAFAAAVLLLLCFFGWLLLQNTATGGCIAEISVAGTVVRRVALDRAEDETFSPVEGVVLSIENHGIRFASSDCKNQTCVAAGLLNKSGQSALCLPHAVTIRLYAAKDETAQPDAIL